jgi:hypothetical protein
VKLTASRLYPSAPGKDRAAGRFRLVLAEEPGNNPLCVAAPAVRAWYFFIVGLYGPERLELRVATAALVLVNRHYSLQYSVILFTFYLTGDGLPVYVIFVASVSLPALFR